MTNTYTLASFLMPIGIHVSKTGQSKINKGVFRTITADFQ